MKGKTKDKGAISEREARELLGELRTAAKRGDNAARLALLTLHRLDRRTLTVEVRPELLA